jgi:hypothetical protein
VLAHASHQGQGEGAVEQCCWGVFLWYRPGLCQYRSKPAAYLLPVSPGVEAKDDRTTHQTQAMPPYLLRHQRPAALSRLSLPVSPSLCLPSCLARTVSLTVSRTASLPVSLTVSPPVSLSPSLSLCRNSRPTQMQPQPRQAGTPASLLDPHRVTSAAADAAEFTASSALTSLTTLTTAAVEPTTPSQSALPPAPVRPPP